MGKRVLLVDDCAASAEPIGEALAGAGYEVVSASNGADCIRAADAARPDLIVLEAQMPVLDGVATLRLLREHAEMRRVPVILLSDREGPVDRAREWASGADMYLTRPVSPRAVLAAANWLVHEKGLWPAA